MKFRWLRPLGACVLCCALAYGMAPQTHAVGEDWQTLYKGELRRILSSKELSPAGNQGAMAVLVDLNLDGTPELLLGNAASGTAQYQYTVTGDKLVPLPLGSKQTGAHLDAQNTKLYFNPTTGEERLTAESTSQPSGSHRSFTIYEYKLESGKLTETALFGYTDSDTRVNGQPQTATNYYMLQGTQWQAVGKEQYQTAMDGYYKDHTLMKEYTTASALLSAKGPGDYSADAVDALLKSYTTGPVKALSAKTSITVDGKALEFDSYNIGGNNYIKLRDLAAALNGSPKQYAVGWDNQSRQVSIESGKPYEPVIGEAPSPQATVPSLGKQPADAYVTFNTQKVEAEKYNINGNNYFKLRDLAQLLDFDLKWNSTTRSITINTSAAYTAS